MDERAILRMLTNEAAWDYFLIVHGINNKITWGIYGYTALSWACIKQNQEIISILINAGGRHGTEGITACPICYKLDGTKVSVNPEKRNTKTIHCLKYVGLAKEKNKSRNFSIESLF